MQQPLFFENELDALKATCQACKGGQKAIALELWGKNMSLDSAKAKLSNCLNPDKPSERLTFQEKRFISDKGKEYGVHHYMQFLSQELGFEMPKPIDKEKQQLDYVNQFIAATSVLEKLAGKIDLEAIQSAQANGLRVAK